MSFYDAASSGKVEISGSSANAPPSFELRCRGLPEDESDALFACERSCALQREIRLFDLESSPTFTARVIADFGCGTAAVA